MEPAVKSAGAATGGADGGLPSHDLRRHRRDGSAGADALHQEVAAAVSRRGGQSEGSGDELFTFLRFPPSQWKALRTTNALERINEEFRRRTKTQASLPGQDAVVLLLLGLLRSGQIKLRVLDGYRDLKEVTKAA